jgi:mannose/fructose/N-acetylgalactosamine-specific phosphotransferase system component IID
VDDTATAKEDNLQAESGQGVGGHFNFFNNKPEVVAQLIGTPSMSDKRREVWKLEPCMPRAVSSEKIATFALGTSIAVGTTIAMPFALAGAGAVLGAVGAEAGVLFNVIAAGLTGAEALASVGAIGATAYIVFRPEDNSLTDDHEDDEEEAIERAWSKRPFSNWRNW